ncbi:ImmA/IrrE family metallo-endopeptidase [Paraburkholderia caledonica]|uniref:ImmA/IrrE family metallo-endopeptidase n=1 Tax=Paraburkholderia caledonica TaxID=134536 RepID=UPI0038BA33A7
MAQTASDLLNTHWDGSLPVDPEKIARSMGVQVLREFGMDGCSGQVQFENGWPVIRYDITEAPVRQRFTIAHEIGHIALGHLNGATTLFRDPPSNFSTGAGKPDETAANAFAADLLMPERVLRYVIHDRGVQDIARLANLFAVSQVAMRYRLMNLGLLPAGQYQY